MDRRQFNQSLAAAVALAATWKAANAETPMGEKPTFTLLIHPGMVMQDLIGPLTAFNLTMGETRLVWKDRAPVTTDVGIPVAATHDFDDCPESADVFFIPGGLMGSVSLMEDAQVLDFVRSRASNARFITSVCTGSLVLGAAGLLHGKRATSHWYVRDLLSHFGATPSDERVATDGNLITGGGVTAGLDFGLTLAAILRGEEWAKRMMLTLEYTPDPPFQGGTPEDADPELVAAVLNRRKPSIEAARKIALGYAENAGSR